MRKIEMSFFLKSSVSLFILTLPFFAHAQRITANPTISLPSWFQAIGTVIGIFVAIFIVVSFYFLSRKWEKERAQKRQEEKRNQEAIETRSLLLATRHELLSYYTRFREEMKEIFPQLETDGFIKIAMPTEYEKFYMYSELATKPNAIMEAKLMTHLLSAYSLQIQWIDVLKWNNYLIESFKKGDVTLSDLKEYAIKIKRTYEAMENECQIVFECINEDGTLNPDKKHKLNLKYYFRNSAQYVQFK